MAHAVNRHHEDKLLNWTKTLQQHIPDASICTHYSVKFNRGFNNTSSEGAVDHAFNTFSSFQESFEDALVSTAIDDDLCKEHKCEILLVSGDYGKQIQKDSSSNHNLHSTSLDILTKLQNLQKDALQEYCSVDRPTKLCVAFNPFHKSSQALDKEKLRLRQKLETGQVRKIYLQFGSDVKRLERGLHWLNTKIDCDKVDVCGSIFLPMAEVLDRLQKRPLPGVYLSQRFLTSGEDYATKKVLKMMQMLKRQNAELVFQHPGVSDVTAGADMMDYLLDRL
jgi:hypothetical protein